MKLSHRKKTARFFKGVIIPIAVLCAIVGICASVLYRAGEYMPIQEVARKVSTSGGVFGSALHSHAYWYKIEVYRRIKPKIAVLGSSRVLLIRPEHFNESFANLGLMSSLDEELEMAQALFDDHAPDILLLEAPWWWFHGAPAASSTKRSPEIVKPDFSELSQPIRWLFSGRLKFADIVRIIFSASPSVGLTGIIQDQGFDAFGSYRYKAPLIGQIESSDKKFQGTVYAKKHGDKAFLGAKHPSKAQWKKFIALLDYLQARKIQVHFFIPPLAEPILKVMKSEGDKYAYISETEAMIEREMSKRGFGFYNFHDGRKIGTTNCEYIDALHGGYITTDRILQHIAGQAKGLGQHMNTNFINKEIETYAGRASMLTDEIDFLEIGCKK